MNIQLVFVIACIVIAGVFMAKKILKTLSGKEGCSCGDACGEKTCQGCLKFTNSQKNLDEIKPS